MAAIPQIPKRALGHTGLHVSILGFGAAPLGSVFQKVEEQVGIRAVEAAFQRGINFFDTSPYYGETKSETVLGKALKALPRDQIIISTKVGRYGVDKFDFSAQRVTASVEESLKRLQIDYIDLIQCHDIEFGDLDKIVNETLPALAALKSKGLVRHVGITGLPLKIFTYVLDRAPPGSVDVVLSYCHYNLCDNSLESILPYLKSKGVGVINASPLAMGLLTPQGPPEWHPAPARLQEATRSAARICVDHGVSLPKLGVQYAVLNPDIGTTLIGICSETELNENCDAVLQALRLIPNPQEEVESRARDAVREVLAPVMNITWPSGCGKNN